VREVAKLLSARKITEAGLTRPANSCAWRRGTRAQGEKTIATAVVIAHTQTIYSIHTLYGLFTFIIRSHERRTLHAIAEGRVRACTSAVRQSTGSRNLGHAKSYVSFDVRRRLSPASQIQRALRPEYHGRGTPDRRRDEERIRSRSNRRKDKLHPMQLVETYTREYFSDMDALNVLRPDISPRATATSTEQISLIVHCSSGRRL